MEKIEKLVIIGSGPAGLTAAIYSARGNLNPVMVAGRVAGGQLTLTTDVDDFPGFPEGIQGPDLMVNMRKQAEKFLTRFIDEDVVSVDFKQKPFIIQTESQTLKAQSVIIATGASAKWLNLESEQKFIGRGVSACAVCDGFFFKDKTILVIGGGDTAMRETQHLAKFGKKVILMHRRSEFRAQAALVNLVKSKTNVEFLMNFNLEEVLGEQKVTGVKIKNVETGEIKQLEMDGVFIAIGHKPNTDFLKGQIDLDEQGYIKVLDEIKSSVEGIFVAGDVADHRYRQAVTAAGAGCKAALDAESFLEQLHVVEVTT
ncbi:thioredoxin-disulfide reductase [Candidatus Daviesbacteria bacterium]|nr:thioredoxin-disulfide reductase [Candidatus Daviesbacteria bacterium]